MSRRCLMAFRWSCKLRRLGVAMRDAAERPSVSRSFRSGEDSSRWLASLQSLFCADFSLFLRRRARSCTRCDSLRACLRRHRYAAATGLGSPPHPHGGAKPNGKRTHPSRGLYRPFSGFCPALSGGLPPVFCERGQPTDALIQIIAIAGLATNL